MLAAVFITISGLALQIWGAILFTVAVPDTSGDFAAYVSGTGSAAAVGGLVYVVKKVFSGDLISRPTSVAEKELVRLINDSHAREALLQSCMQSKIEHEKRNNDLTEDLIRAVERLPR